MKTENITRGHSPQKGLSAVQFLKSASQYGVKWNDLKAAEIKLTVNYAVAVMRIVGGE